MRLFVALEIPSEVRESLSSLIEQLKPKCREPRWVRSEGLHITLKFIGHLDQHEQPEKLTAIESALASIASAASNEPIEMQFRGLSFFPDERRPRVLWCGVNASPNLTALAQAMDRDLAQIGIASESRPFVPHLTLARFSTAARCPAIVSATRESRSQDFGAAGESAFHLFESFTKPSGAEYKCLRTFSFAKEPL